MTFQSARTQSYIFSWDFLNSCTATYIQGSHQANFIFSFVCEFIGGGHNLSAKRVGYLRATCLLMSANEADENMKSNIQGADLTEDSLPTCLGLGRPIAAIYY